MLEQPAGSVIDRRVGADDLLALVKSRREHLSPSHRTEVDTVGRHGVLWIGDCRACVSPWTAMSASGVGQVGFGAEAENGALQSSMPRSCMHQTSLRSCALLRLPSIQRRCPARDGFDLVKRPEGVMLAPPLAQEHR